MTEREQRDWRELCNAAIAAKDPDELLQIVQQLNPVLEREERARQSLFSSRIKHTNNGRG